MESLRYPIGKYTPSTTISKEKMLQFLDDIATFPDRLQFLIAAFNNEQLDTEYRPGGWTIRQVIHHCADSHMNSLIRIKLALTEEIPTIKPYYEERWAELEDSKSLPIDSSLKILEGVHYRASVLLKSLSADQLKRSFIHPDSRTHFTVLSYTELFAWHCNHHLGHVSNVRF